MTTDGGRRVPQRRPLNRPIGNTAHIRRKISAQHYQLIVGGRTSMPELGFYVGSKELNEGDRVLVDWREESRLWLIVGPLHQAPPPVACTLALLATDTSTPVNGQSPATWRGNTHLAVVTSGTNRIRVLPWTGTAFGAPIMHVGVSSDRHCDWSPDGTKLAVANAIGGVVRVYSFDGLTLTLLATSTITAIGTSVTGLKWSPDQTAIAIVAVAGASRLAVLPWNDATSTFGAGVTPAVPAPTAASVRWSPDSSAVTINTTASPFLALYPWSGSALGTVVVPAAVSGITASSNDWHPSGAWIAQGLSDPPFCEVFSWDGASFGAPITPTLSGAGVGQIDSVAWSHGGGTLFSGGQGADGNLTVYGYGFDPVLGAFDGHRCDAVALQFAASVAVSADDRFLAKFDISEDLLIYSTGLEAGGFEPTEQLAGGDVTYAPSSPGNWP